MEVQVPFGKRCLMKWLIAVHTSFIDEALDTFGAFSLGPIPLICSGSDGSLSTPPFPLWRPLVK